MSSIATLLATAGLTQSKVVEIFVCMCAVPTILWFTIYVSTNLYMLLMGPVNLKKKYSAKWAVVTGASMGIGKSIAETLALQGLSVVLVALPPRGSQPDDLKETTEILRKLFPKQEFRAVYAVFDHKTDYMPAIIEATKDIDVQVVFNNAGYMVTGFFDSSNLDAQLGNIECNATACVKVTHHFLQKMMQKKLKGCFVYTSSVSGFIPNPFAVCYGATKAFVTEFAASLAVEVRNHGIDVVSVHPSPVNSNFFNVNHKIESLEMARRMAVTPESVPIKMLSCVGRCHLGDLGGMAVGMRIIVACIPFDFFAGMFSYFAPIMDDYKRHNANRGTTEARLISSGTPSPKGTPSKRSTSRSRG